MEPLAGWEIWLVLGTHIAALAHIGVTCLFNAIIYHGATVHKYGGLFDFISYYIRVYCERQERLCPGI